MYGEHEAQIYQEKQVNTDELAGTDDDPTINLWDKEINQKLEIYYESNHSFIAVVFFFPRVI